MNRRKFLRDMMLSFATTTALARTSLNIANEPAPPEPAAASYTVQFTVARNDDGSVSGVEGWSYVPSE